MMDRVEVNSFAVDLYDGTLLICILCGAFEFLY